VKVKQHTLQSFEFILSNGDEDRLFSYINQNEPLLKGHAIIISKDDNFEISETITSFLKEKELCYFFKECNLSTRKKSVVTLPNMSIEEAFETIKKSEDIEEEKTSSKETIREVIEKPIRSGTYINSKNDLTVLSQINAGSEVEVEGNLEVFGSVNGRVICRGIYMLLRDIGETGLVIFNGIILDKERFKSRKAKLLKLNGEKRLLIEEL
jgi:septum site-determining protein MinC